MQLSATALALLGLVLAGWVAGAAWLMIAAGAKARKAEASRKAARRMVRMIDESPAIPLIVRVDGRIEASERLAGWLGLPKLPQYLSELAGELLTFQDVAEAVEYRQSVERRKIVAAA